MVDIGLSEYILEMNIHIRVVRESVANITSKISESQKGIVISIKRITDLRNANLSKAQQKIQYKIISKAIEKLSDDFELFSTKLNENWNEIHSKFMIIYENPLAKILIIKNELDSFVAQINDLKARSLEIKKAISTFKDGVNGLNKIDKTIEHATFKISKSIYRVQFSIDGSIKHIDDMVNKYSKIGQEE